MLAVGVVRVRGRSMEPTLRDGDLLLVRWHPRRARLGSVVVVRLPASTALANPLPADRPLSVKRLTGRVDGGWWVERDNPAEGVDSWLVGAVPEAGLAGLVLCRIAPDPGRIALRLPH